MELLFSGGVWGDPEHAGEDAAGGLFGAGLVVAVVGAGFGGDAGGVFGGEVDFTPPVVLVAVWTAISFVDGSEKLELWFRLPSWFSPIPDGLRSGYGTRSRNEAWSDCNRVQSMMSPL